jgi:hypothetical protein
MFSVLLKCPCKQVNLTRTNAIGISVYSVMEYHCFFQTLMTSRACILQDRETGNMYRISEPVWTIQCGICLWCGKIYYDSCCFPCWLSFKQFIILQLRRLLVMWDIVISGLPAVHIRISFLFSCCKCLLLWEDEPGREQIATEGRDWGRCDEHCVVSVCVCVKRAELCWWCYITDSAFIPNWVRVQVKLVEVTSSLWAMMSLCYVKLFRLCVAVKPGFLLWWKKMNCRCVEPKSSTCRKAYGTEEHMEWEINFVISRGNLLLLLLCGWWGCSAGVRYLVRR